MTDLNPTALEAASESAHCAQGFDDWGVANETEREWSSAIATAVVEAYLANLPQTPTDHTGLIAQLRSNADAHNEPEGTERRRAAAALEGAARAFLLAYHGVDLFDDLDDVGPYTPRANVLRGVAAALEASRPLTPSGLVADLTDRAKFSATQHGDDAWWRGHAQGLRDAIFEIQRAALTPETGDVREALAKVIAQSFYGMEMGAFPVKGEEGEPSAGDMQVAGDILNHFTVTPKGTPETDEDNG